MAFYDAFISYSHARDKPVAAALQTAIQKLGKPWYRRRALRLFRDDTSLSATPHLWSTVQEALASSRYFILLVSPEAAASKWVDREVSYWLDHNSIETLLIGITDGEIFWDESVKDFTGYEANSLPPALRGRFSSEPKWIDLRTYREKSVTRRDSKFTDLAADFASAIRGIPKEDLLSQELSQQRRALSLASSAVVFLAMLTALAVWQWQEAIKQKNRAENTLNIATRSANDLVLNVAVKIRHIVGIPVELVGDILDRARDLQDQLIKYNPSNVGLKRSQAVALREMSQTLLLQGAAENALKIALSSLDIMTHLLDADPENSPMKRELSRSYNRMGEALSRLGRHDEALEAFQNSVAIGESLTGSVSGTESERDLAVSYERLGDELFTVGRREDALDAYQNSLAIREKLSSSNPDNLLWQADLAVSYDRIGRTYEDQPEKAILEYLHSLDVWQKLVIIDPRDTGWQRNLASTYDSIGMLLLRSAKPDEAIQNLKKSLEIREKLARSSPDVPQWQVNIVISLINLAEAGDDPKDRYVQAIAILRRLASENKLTADQMRWSEEIERRLDKQNH